MDGFNRRKIYLAANRHALSGSIFHTEFPILHFIRHMNTLSSLDKLRHRRPGSFVVRLEVFIPEKLYETKIFTRYSIQVLSPMTQISFKCKVRSQLSSVILPSPRLLLLVHEKYQISITIYIVQNNSPLPSLSEYTNSNYLGSVSKL